MYPKVQRRHLALFIGIFAFPTLAFAQDSEEIILPNQTQLNHFVDQYISSIQAQFDSEHGGFGTGKKIPQGRAMMAVLDRLDYGINEQHLWPIIEKTLEGQYTDRTTMQSDYNLYDPIEGGVHRYGKDRDYTPPYFEKILSDNAIFLQLYTRIAQDYHHPLAIVMAEGTHSFLIQQMYFPEIHGFFSSVDAHTEFEYYGQKDRPSEKPHFESTQYTDELCDAIIALLRIEPEIALDTLHYLLEHMVDENGVYHVRTSQGAKEIQGNVRDVAYLLLATIEAYFVTDDQQYEDAAIALADFALSHFYDRNGGGFFKQHTQDMQHFANAEIEENGIMTYALLKLHNVTGNLRYRNAAVKTMGRFSEHPGNLDLGYYQYKAADWLLQSSAFMEMQEHRIDTEEQETLLLNNGNAVEPTASNIMSWESIFYKIVRFLLLIFY